MEQATTARFVHAARSLGALARSRGLVAPSFRSPPRILGVSRTLKRWDAGAQVAVLVRGRPWAAVLADMVEGVVAANKLKGLTADRLRTELWQVCDPTSTPDFSAKQRSVA
jgi:hypothetical protein